MPTYEYRCPDGHVTEQVQSMHDEIPATITCDRAHVDDDDAPCLAEAARVWAPPAAIHYKGPGFYTTDVKMKYERKRRKNAGDDLPLPAEAAITRAEGAEKDNDPRGFNRDGTIRRAAA